MSILGEVLSGEEAEAQEPRKQQDQRMQVMQFLQQQAQQRQQAQQEAQLQGQKIQANTLQQQQEASAKQAQAAGMADYLSVLKGRQATPGQGAVIPSGYGPDVSPAGYAKQPEMAPLTFDTVSASILKQKPNISPDEFVAAMKQFEPQFEQNDKMKLAQVEAQVKNQNVTPETQMYSDAIKQGMQPAQAMAQIQAAKAQGAGQVEAAKKAADDAEKMKAAKPKAEQMMKGFVESESDAGDTINDALKQSNSWTTGFMGAVNKHVPGTEAYNLHANLQKLESRLGLDTLTELKNNSPNGSALGRVTNYEMGILVKAKANLDQAQSQSQFEAALKDLKVKIANSKKHVKEAYDETYGDKAQKDQAQSAAPAAKTVDFNDWK